MCGILNDLEAGWRDEFAGSGSMLRACEKRGRMFVGIDNNPSYCEKLVGQGATLI